MAYTNCGVCGAKALVGATRCPRCQAPFVSYDVKGKRVPTLNCPVCGVQRPTAIGACPNCLTSTGPSRVRVTRSLLLSGVAIAVILAVGYAVSRLREYFPTATPPAVTAGSTADSTRLLDAAGADSGFDSTQRKEPTSPASVSVVVASAPVDSAVKPPKPAPAPAVAVADTGRWEDAIATTWVHVRSAPSRGSEVLRLIDSAQHVRLGPPTAGWRPVRVGVDRGWVDPRLFIVVPVRRP